MNLVAPSGYNFFDNAKPTGYYLTRADSPYGVQKAHLRYLEPDELFYPTELNDPYDLESNPVDEKFANQWIGAINWKVPDDPIPLNLSPLNVASLGKDISNHAAIHEEFADIEFEADLILSFCSEYGFLGQNTYLLKLEDGSLVWGESVQEWVAEVHKLRMLRRIWVNLLKRESDSVHEYYSNFNLDMAFVNHDRLIAWPASSGDLREDFDLRYIEPEKDADGLSYRTAKTVFHGLLRRAIRNTCSPDFSLENGAQIDLEPKSLLGMIYLRFLETVISQAKPIRKCRICGEYFELFDQRTIYCSQPCKQKAYRARKDKKNGNKTK